MTTHSKLASKMADIHLDGVEHTELCVYYHSTVTGATHTITSLQGFATFKNSLHTHALDPRHWINPGLVFDFTGHHDDTVGSARAVDHVRQVLVHLHRMNWNKSLAWIQFIHFWSLDFSDAIGLRRDPIQVVPGSPNDLVFSECTIGNYQSLERLALRTTWADDPTQCQTRITLDQGTNVYSMHVPNVPGAECQLHSLRICGVSKYNMQTAKVLQMCPRLKRLMLSLEPDTNLKDIIKSIQSSLNERPPGYKLLPELIIDHNQPPGQNPWIIIEGELGPLCGTKISGLTGPRPEDVGSSWVRAT
ncbi:hypothetical protein QCA50_009503 [Cerrena zonata]|uniref:Uncharacterized protein n=1 Tax=Cerrena zonata TaxID=2478898 RepID=A0AAW0G6D2_9APHY